ncbi:MAG: hypothetical protein ACO1SV_06340 [Fimbriimonas sp.]
MAAVGATLAVSYSLARSTWRNASEAEVRAEIDPQLLEVEPRDPRAQVRMDRLEALVNRIGTSGVFSIPPPSEADVHVFLTREAASLRALRSLLAEGPLQHRDRLPGEPDGSYSNRYFPCLASISTAARIEAKAGRLERSASLFLLALDLTNRLLPARASGRHLTAEIRAEEFVYKSVGEALPYLREPQLRALAAKIPTERATREAVRRSIRGEFQKVLLPVLPDPVARLRRESPKVDPEEAVAILTSHGAGGDGRALGNYDALQSARDANRIFALTLANASKRRADQDLSGDAFAKDLEDSLPVYQGAGKTGIEAKLRAWQYRWELARVPNSTGRGLVTLFRGFPDRARTLYGALTAQEGVRTLIALRRYQLLTGSRAPDLSVLLKAKLLPALPSDHLGTGPLRYDSATRRLWSVGVDGKDGGGVSMGPATRPADIVWTTP